MATGVNKHHNKNSNKHSKPLCGGSLKGTFRYVLDADTVQEIYQEHLRPIGDSKRSTLVAICRKYKAYRRAVSSSS